MTAQSAAPADAGWRVLIIGCGNIAGGFDVNQAASDPPLTHAGAFSRHGAFRIVACVEPDATRRAAFARHWRVPRMFASVDQLEAEVVPGAFDVISICSPTRWHHEHLLTAARLRPQLVFCEKPMCESTRDAAELARTLTRSDIAVAVNLTRRWAPDVMRLADELHSGVWGAVRSAIGTYNKGVLNNGTHMIDLLHLLIGPLTLHSTGPACFDHWPDDPTVSALLLADGDTPVHLVAGHATDAAVFELQLITQKGVITMEDGGLNWRVRRIVDSPVFAGYRVLDSGTSAAGEYLLATERAVANLHQHLCDGARLRSTAENALSAQRLCEDMRAAALSASAPIQPTPGPLRSIT